ncbi:hypothetical protein [Leifsonia sp. fls2-241-R2A-40a]|uniref:hypothetical protein n=1 Tax=Leifsonia sp. fls2-241-R2A-40a TaxID=3040290 RepID=UPI00254A7DA7|nr:hypothetical protein [Leifsonia sp. fls2-241-R2A-40a]
MQTETATAAPRPRFRERLFSRASIGPALLILASLLVGIVQVPAHKGVSPVDEYVYIDYFAKVATQGTVHRGEQTGTFARQELGCRGLRLLQPAPDARCSLTNAENKELFPFHGATSAYIYTPLYFAITRVLAEPLVWAGVGLVDAGRFIGAIWLAAAALLLYLALRRLRVHPVAATATGLLMIGSLPAYWSNTYISTDATALFAGGLMLYLATFVEHRRGRILFVAGAAFVTLLKVQNLAAVAAAVLFVLLRVGVAAYRERSSRASWIGRLFADSRTITVIVAVVVSVAAQLAWLVYSNATAVGPAPDMGKVRPLGITSIILQSGLFIDTATKGVGDITTFLKGPGLFVNYAVSWIAVAGVIGLLMVARWGRRRNAVALATFAAAVISAPLLSAVTYVTLGTYPDPPPGRYGISLVPLFLACAALLLARRPVPRWIFAGVGALTFLASLVLPQG